jgi:hypothetical protein
LPLMMPSALPRGLHSAAMDETAWDPGAAMLYALVVVLGSLLLLGVGELSQTRAKNHNNAFARRVGDHRGCGVQVEQGGPLHCGGS